MTSPDAARPVTTVIDALARATDGFFRDPHTGDVVLVEHPNAQMKTVGGILALNRMLRRAKLVDRGDWVDVLLERAAMATLIWWSFKQLRHGTTKYLKTIGAVTLAGAIARTIIADPAHGLSTQRDRQSTPA
jgi:hypothetical protein